MKLAIIFASFLVLALTPALTGIDLTKTGPDYSTPVWQHGGGGGP